MSKSENPEANNSFLISTYSCIKTKRLVFVPVASVCLLIIGVWSLVFLPIIFYHYLPKSQLPFNTSGTKPSDNKSMCLAPVQYAVTSGICLTEIANILMSSNCPPDPEGYLLVMSNEETTATQLINGLTSLGASAECLNKAVPFLCLHLFGLCSGPGVSIQPTSSQCEEVRDTTCQQQWLFIESLDIGLPDCEIFPAESLACPASNDSTSGTLTTNVLEKYSSNTTPEVLECTGDYYQENGSSFCTRSCYSWVELGNGKWVIVDVLAVVWMTISFLSSGAIFVISFCLARKRMLIFPSVLVVYMVTDYTILGLFVLIAYMDRSGSFCSSRSMVKSLREVTPFCVIFGILEVYMSTQMVLWWLFHTMTFFYKVIFPLHARSFEAAGKKKYIHVACIIIGILIPLVPIITIMADTAEKFQKQHENSTSQLRNRLFLSEGLGFGYTSFPPFLCYTTNSDAVFYSSFLIMDISLGCGCTMLIIIFWWVHKAFLKMKQVQNIVNFKREVPQFTLGTAEKKLIVLLCYYVIFAAIVLTELILESKMSLQTIIDLQKFLFCEQASHNSSNLCIRNGGIAGNSIGFALFRILAYLVLGSFSLVNLLYVVDISELKKLRKKSGR